MLYLIKYYLFFTMNKSFLAAAAVQVLLLPAVLLISLI